MIRFAWREFRTRAVVIFATLVIAAAVLAITGANLVHLYDTTVAHCRANNNCSSATALFLGTDSPLQTAIDIMMVVVPALLGIFWGAPLIARELEAGTHRLAWTQSVTRTRWLAAKIGVAGLCSLLVTGLLSLIVTWWFSPLDRTAMNIFGSFEQRDLVPIGYAAFAFALGVSCGALLRRTLPAMAATLVGFVVVRVAVSGLLRPNLMTPLQKTVADTVIGSLGSGGHTSITPAEFAAAQASLLPPNAWLITNQTINGVGQVIGQGGLVGGATDFNQDAGGYALTIQGAGTCPDITTTPPANPFALIQQCADHLRIRDVLTYQPGDRYWPFQGYELAIFLALALLLFAFCFWWIRRRAS